VEFLKINHKKEVIFFAGPMDPQTIKIIY